MIDDYRKRIGDIAIAEIALAAMVKKVHVNIYKRPAPETVMIIPSTRCHLKNVLVLAYRC
jgi:hypothetical protein